MNNEQVHAIAAAREAGLSWAEIAVEYGFVSADAARMQFRRARARPEVPANDDLLDPALLILDRKEVCPLGWRELLDLAQRTQAANAAVEDSQEFCQLHIDSDEPIAVMYSGDWHLGGRVDYDSWAADIEFVLNTDGLYLVDLGDDIDNMRSFRDLSAVLSGSLSPKQQVVLLTGLIDELTAKEKLLAKVSGNHDEEFDERLFGQSIQGYLLRNMRAPRFRNRGLLKLTVGTTTYTNLLFHKSRFSSFMRAAHGNYREYTMHFPADVVAGAHTHAPGVEAIWHYTEARRHGFDFGGMSLLIKVGSPAKSAYGWRYFHHESYASPTVVYWPHEHKKLWFLDPRDAVQFIRSLKGA